LFATHPNTHPTRHLLIVDAMHTEKDAAPAASARAFGQRKILRPLDNRRARGLEDTRGRLRALCLSTISLTYRWPLVTAFSGRLLWPSSSGLWPRQKAWPARLRSVLSCVLAGAEERPRPSSCLGDRDVLSLWLRGSWPGPGFVQVQIPAWRCVP
jgi:hypothetical protein